MPSVADTPDVLSGTQYPSAREKTALIMHNGLYEFLIMLFTLTNSGASFQ